MKNKKLRKTKRKGFFAAKYSESFSYIRESKNFIYFSIFVFVAASLLSFLLPVPENLREQIIKFIEELISQTEGMGQFEITKFIFLNNLQSSFTGMILGVFFGIFPLAVAIVNGYLLGFVSSASIQSEGIFIMWRLVPHGIFELPAIFISLGIGLKFGTFIFQKNKSESFRRYLWNSLQLFVLIIMPLLIAAAIIEGALITFAG